MQVVIVRQGEFSTFARLSRMFANESAVRLIWDRRLRDRRQQASPCGADQRRRERRAIPPTTWTQQRFVMVEMESDRRPFDGHQNGLGWARLVPLPEASPEIQNDIELAIKLDHDVLVTGGTGAVRHSLARWIHERGSRAGSMFVVYDRQGASAWLHESSLDATASNSAMDRYRRARWGDYGPGGGTLFIEELADLTSRQRVELMNYLDKRAAHRARLATSSGDMRILAASGLTIEDEDVGSTIEKALFYRLNLIHLVLPGGAVGMQAVTTAMESPR